MRHFCHAILKRALLNRVSVPNAGLTRPTAAICIAGSQMHLALPIAQCNAHYLQPDATCITDSLMHLALPKVRCNAHYRRREDVLSGTTGATCSATRT